MSAPTVAEKRRRRREARKSVTLADVPGVTIRAPEPVCNDPTPERMAKGAWVIGSKTRVYRDMSSTPLFSAHHHGAISLAMREAGERYYKLRAFVSKSLGGHKPRDSLDFFPRGAGETSPEYAARMRVQDMECTRALIVRADDGRVFSLQGWVDMLVMAEVPMGRFDMRDRRMQGTVAGLRVLVRFFGIPVDEDE